MAAKRKMIIVAISLILFSTQAWGDSGWTSSGAIVELNATTFGRFLVKVDVSSNPSGCRNKQWFYRNYSGTGSDHMFRALLGAVTSGKNVRVYVTGGCDIDGYSEISSASIFH